MKTRDILLVICISALSVFGFAGCTTMNTFSPSTQDFAEAANAMTHSLVDNMVNTGKLEAGRSGEPVLMVISRIQNNTSQALETDLLIKKIRVALNQTGKVQTSTTIGLSGAEDPLAAERQQVAEFSSDQKHPRLPDYSLSGKIIEVREKVGRKDQAAFVFQLSLSSTAGVAVWEDEKTIIIKKGGRTDMGE